MLREIDEIPSAARRLAAPGAQADVAALAARLRALAPPAVLTVARGSSDHAATYLSYVIGHALGLPVASVGPSLHSIWGRDLQARGTVTLAISQSGQSRDILALTEALSAAGSLTVAVTDKPDSPLARTAELRLATLAGPETAVAATKSFSNSILAGLWLAAHWAEDTALIEALLALPDRLAAMPRPAGRGCPGRWPRPKRQWCWHAGRGLAWRRKRRSSYRKHAEFSR